MTSERAESPAVRLAFLDGMRAVAAVYVVVFHAMSMLEQDSTGFVKLLRVAFQFGHEAVAIFIVLSGYCLMLPVARLGVGKLPTSVGTFLKRRAFRILPPYYAALALSLFLLWAIPSLSAGRPLPELESLAVTTHLLLVHNWLPLVAYKINGPHWSVATEFQIYVIYALALLPLYRRFGPRWLTLIAVIVGYAPWVLAPEASHVAAPWYLVLFVFGMWAAVFASRSQDQAGARGATWLRGSTLAALLLCAAFALGAPRVWFRSRPITDLLVGVNATLVLVQVSAATSGRGLFGWLKKLLESRPAVTIGRFSYSLYLTHLPVLALCLLAVRPVTASPTALALLLLGVGTAFSLLVGALFWYLVERRFIGHMNRPSVVFSETRPGNVGANS